MRSFRLRIQRMRDNEDGLTLPELIIYSLLAVVVLGIVGNILIQSLKIERSVRAVTETTTQAQLGAYAVQTGIRNASDFQLTDNGDDQLLVARTAGSGATLTWSCVAWYYSDSEGTIRQSRSPAAITMPSAADLLDWSLIAEDIARPASPSFDGIFSGGFPALSIQYIGNPPDETPVAINSSATARTDLQESAPCF